MLDRGRNVHVRPAQIPRQNIYISSEVVKYVYISPSISLSIHVVSCSISKIVQYKKTPLVTWSLTVDWLDQHNLKATLDHHHHRLSHTPLVASGELVFCFATVFCNSSGYFDGLFLYAKLPSPCSDEKLIVGS
jgi:hypothetical protein